MRLSSLIKRSFKVVNLGRLSYTEGLKQQQKFLDLVKKAKAEEASLCVLLFLRYVGVLGVSLLSPFSETFFSRLNTHPSTL